MAIDKYLENITSEHRGKPKFEAWLSSGLTILDHAYLCAKSIDPNFDLDNAIGVQLDILGQSIGRERTLKFQPQNTNPVLDDEYYRLILKAKIAMNNWDGKIPSIYAIWDNVFDDLGLQIQDNQDMSFDAYITGYIDSIKQELIQRGYIVPKPEGVRVNLIGRTPMDFKPYIGMVVSSQNTININMDFDPKESMDKTAYSVMTVQGICTSIINFEGISNPKQALTSDEGKYLLTNTGLKLLVEKGDD